jgi:hypothetical protein
MIGRKLNAIIPQDERILHSRRIPVPGRVAAGAPARRPKGVASIGVGPPPVYTGPPFFPAGQTDHHPIAHTFPPVDPIASPFRKMGSAGGNPRHPLFLLLVFYKGTADYDDVHG